MKILLILCILVVGLVAGLFFNWSVAIIPGLKKVPDLHYITTLQQINQAIQNPAFFSIFFGALILLPLNTYLSFSASPTLTLWLLTASCLIYFIGVFGITVFGNVPLNNWLSSFSLNAASQADMAMAREKFESRWNMFNHIRCIASVITFLLLLISVFASKSGFLVKAIGQ